MGLLQAVLSNTTHVASIVAASILWSRLLRGLDTVPAIFADFAPPKEASASLTGAVGALPAPSAPPVPQLPGASSSRRARAAAPTAAVAPVRDLAAAQAAMMALVTEVVCSMLGADVAPDQPLMEAGLDSLGEPHYRRVAMAST